MTTDRSETISDPPARRRETRSPKSRMLAFVLAFVFGAIGLHRFYVGKFWTGLLFFLTGGGLGIWWIVDLVLIGTGRFKDSEGRVLGPPREEKRANRPRVESERTRTDSEAPRGTDGHLEGDDPLDDDLDEFRVETEDGEEFHLDDEQLMGDPIEKEFEELERQYEEAEKD